jgi:hypothetical protein
LGATPGAKTRLLSFNGTHSSVLTGLLTGHNALRRRLHLTGLTYVVGVEWRMKLSMSVKLWLHSDMHTLVPFSWI